METKDQLAVTGCLAMLLAIPFLCVLNGYVLTLLWLWFIVPTFHAMPLGIPNAIGLSCVVGYMTSHTCAQEKGRSFWELYGAMFSRPLFALGFGWIIRHWM